MEARREGRVRVAKASFPVGQQCASARRRCSLPRLLNRISAPEIYRVATVIARRPRAVYELADLNGTPTEGQFYREELTTINIMDRTVYKSDKILDKRVRRGIREFLVRWRGYSQDIDCCVPGNSVKNI